MLLLTGASRVANAVTIGSQDFESSPAAPTLTYSASGGGLTNGNSAAGDRPASSPLYSDGSRAYSIINGTATLTFGTTNVVNYSNIRLSVRVSSWSVNSTGNGADAADSVQIQLSTNGGTTYITQTAVGGNASTANSYWNYTQGTATGVATYINSGTAVTNRPGGGGSRTTDGYSTLIVTNIPPSDQLRIRVIMLNNATGERWTIDQVTLTGDSASCSPNAVTFVQQTGNYITWADSGGVFNQGSDQMGMYANGGGAKQVVAWRDFRTDGSGGGSQRDLQPGDRFRISLQGTSPFGILGVSLNDTNASTSGWNNRTNSTRGFIQCGNSYGDLYVTHGGGTPSWSGVTPVNQVTIVFDVLSSSEFTANIEGQTAKYDLTMLNNPGFDDRISGFSLYYNDDWNGTRNSNAYWRQTTLVTNLGVIQLGGDSGTQNIVGKITDGSSPACVASTSTNVVRKTGTGTITLQHTTNTYSGGTRIEAGTLAVFTDRNLGAVPSVATNNIDIWGSGTLRATNSFTLNANRTIQLGNVNNPTNEVDSGQTLTYGGVIGGDANWSKAGAGILALTGTSSTNKGRVSVQAGTLRIAGDGSLGTAPGSATEKINIWSTGTFEADGTFTLNANRSIELGTVNGPKLSVTSGNTLTYGGAISGSANWTKESAGRLTLTGAGSASGTLTINAGELIHNGTNASMGVTVSASTFANGAGSVGALTISGQASAGSSSNTVGRLLASSANLQNNGIMQINISAITGTAGVNWDVINVGSGSGTYTVNAVDGSDFVIALKGNPAFDNTLGYTNILVDAGTASGFATNKFTINTSEFSPALGGGTFTVDAVGGDLRLLFIPAVSAVPEIALLGTNGATIANNDSTPATADGTDFGSVLWSGSYTVTNVFSITNSGNSTLNISGITTNSDMGAGADFIILSYPVSVSAGTRSNLFIAFNPTASGIRTATVIIANNTSGNNPFSFALRGDGAVTNPTVVTTIATATNLTTATSGGNVTSDGGVTVTNRGVVWSTSAAPTVPGIQSTNGTGTGSYSSTLTNLTPGQTYFYRAFAQNTAGTSYGSEYSLTTPCFSGVVTGLYASVTNDTNFTAVWSNFAGATGYQLDVSTNSLFGGVGSSLEVVRFDFPAAASLFANSVDAAVTVSVVSLSSGTIETNITTGTYFPNEPYVEETTGWAAASQAAAKYFQITIYPLAGQSVTITGISYRAYATGAGPSAFSHDIDSSSATYTVNAPDSSLVFVNQPVTNVVGRSTPIVIKIQGWDNGSRSTTGAGVYRLDDLRITGTAGSSPDYVPGYSNRAVSATSISVTGLVSGATYYYRVRATNVFCVTGNSTTSSVTTLLLNPIVHVRGNGVIISDNDTTPTITDHTDFGAVGLNQSNLVRIFTITNSGTASLTVGNVTTSGAAASDFVIISQPSSPVAVSGSTTFQVRFDPSATGLRTAVVEFTTSVSSNNPYNFTIQGTGVAAGIKLSTNAISLTSMVGSSVGTSTFAVTNVGRGRLDYAVTTNVNWLSVSPVSANLAETAGQQETITYSIAGFSAGTSNATITITDANASNSPQTVTVSLTLTNIPDPTAQSATADGYEMIRLAWTKRASHDVMIVYRQGAASTAPAQGVTYALGDVVGSGGVIYKGSGASLEHIVAPGNDHYYAFYSINNNHYSPGVTFFTNTGSYAISEIVDAFAYTNGVSFSSAPTENGGNGWAGAWSVGAGTWNADSGSMDVNTNYPDEVANSLKLTNPGNGQLGYVTRTVTPFTNGYLYASVIVRFQYNGGNKYTGIELTSNGNAKAFFGEIRDQDLRPGVAPSATSSAWNYDGSYGMNDYNSNTGNVYMIVGRYNFSTRQFDMAVFYKTTTIPALEPGTWNATTTLAAGTMNSVDGIRLVAGSSDGGAALGDAFFDEVRVADSWSELIGQFPEPEIAILGTNYAVIADGEAAASSAKGTDFGSTAVTGGQVDRTFYITNSGAGLLNISGVTTSGAHAAEFIVINYPLSVYPGTASNFVLRFDPSSAGSRTATVVVANDDSDEGNYDFVVQGTGQVPPTVTTTVANPTNQTTATSGGNVTDEGFAAVTNRGVVWSVSINPTVPGIQTTNGTGSGSFVSTLTGLAPGGTYYYRAFAQNAAGTSYGSELSLTTPCFSGVVTGLYVSATNDINFTAAWSNVAGATGYQLDVSTTNTFSATSSGNYGVESMTNVGGGTTSSYLTRQWTNNAIAWTSLLTRTDQTVNGTDAITLQNASGAYLTSQPIPGGISELKITHQLKFTGADSFDVFVNSIKVATNIVYSSSVQTAVIQNIDISGDFVITITNKSGGRVALDDVTWTNASGSSASFVAGYENRPVPGLSHTVTGLTPGVTYYYRVRATNEYCTTGDSVTGSVTTVILASDIDIYGNGLLIADGDVTPNPADHTDFGAVGLINSNLVRTFTITNDGPGSLVIYNVTTSGAAASDFVVIAAPGTPVAAGGSTTFQVRFDPSAANTRTATIVVSNNAPGSLNLYSFVVQGTGVASGISFTPTNFNLTTMVGSSPSTLSFGVTNVGLGDLIYTLSSNVNWFSVTPVSGTNAETAGRQHLVFFNVAGLVAGVSNGAITITSATASNSPQVLPITITLTNIPEVLAATVTNDGNEMVRLHWTMNSSHSVLITHRQTNAPSTPVQGTTYSAAGTIGSDGTRVIYKGTGTNLEHIVNPGSLNHYAFYSINNNHYSIGLQTNTTMGTYAVGEVVENFSYTNATLLASRGGGQGFSGNWLGDTNRFTNILYSFSSQDVYPSNRANKVVTTPASATTNIVRRSLGSTYGSGVIYVSYVMNFQYNGPDKFSGLSLMSNTTEKLFVGEVGSADERLGLDGTSSSEVLTAGFGNDYIIILRYSWASGTADAVAYKIGTDSVPETEPGTWDVTLSKASNVVGRINGIRLASGAGAGTPGETYFDEIRVATSWSELLQIAPSRVIYDWFANSSGTVSGNNGGTGWSNTWTFGGDAYIDFTGTSIPKEKSSYHEPQGNKIVMYGDVDDRDMTLSRNFLTPFTTGVVYFSWMQNYEFSGINKHAGLSLMDGTTEKAFIGKVNDGTFEKRFGVSSSTDNLLSQVDLEPGTGQDYVIVGRYDFSTRELSATFYKTTEESIAEEPHGYWYVTTTQTVGHITNLSGIRFAIGAGAGIQIGDVYMDEIRVGTNWFEVNRRDGESQSQAMAAGPIPKLLYIGTNYVPTTNPQGTLANITITDADLVNNSEPLDIAVLWSNANGVFLTNSTASITNFGSRVGRINPNFDPVVLSGSELLSIGFDGVFTNYSGRNGSLTATSYVHGAFSITNSSINDTYFITMSAENNNLGGGTFAAHNTGDQIPYWRALTVNTALQFFVDDDDPVPPQFFEYTIKGDGGFGDTNITAGGIAIIGVNGAPSTQDERFSFVVLRPFPIGTIIDFVDCGWDPNSNTWHRLTEFHTNRWISPGNVSVGQVIELELQDINNSGDQVVVYQYNGSLTATNDSGNVDFIYAVNLDVDGNGWDVNPIPNDNEHSGLYRGLTNGISAVSVPLRSGYRANAYYTGTVVGTASDLLLSISDSNNWYVVPSASATDINITNYSFTITGSGTIDWTLASLSDEEVLLGGYAITNIAWDEYSGLVASNTTFANGPQFMLFNTNNTVVASNGFTVTFANEENGIQAMVMNGPAGSYADITIGTVSSFVYVADMDRDRVNDHLDSIFSMPVYVYDDDPGPPLIGTNLVTMMLGETALNTTNRSERLAAWSFNDMNSDVDHGVGIFTNNLSGSISYANSGTAINAVTNDVAGNDITITGTANIGRYLQFGVDMTGHQNLILTMAAQRSAAGYDSNTISYAVNGGAPVEFQTGWAPASSYALATFDFSAITAINNATSVNIFITFGTNSATGGGNNRFDNIQLNASLIRYYEITDAALALVNSTNALNFSFNVFDDYSGIARGTANTGTNMLINIDGFATNDTASFNSSLSSASSLSNGSTSMWTFADSISYVRRGELYADGQSNRTILATLADLDNDRPDDTLWASNTFFGKFRVIDDDPNAPITVDITYGLGTINNRPFYVATNGYSPGSSELIRGNYERRSGVGSTSVFAVTDADLARSGTDGMEFVFGVNDLGSGIGRGTSGFTNTVMSFSLGSAVTGNFNQFNAGLSSAPTGPGVIQSNIWTFANGYFDDTIINNLMAASSNRVSITVPDVDNDRTNDNATLYSQTVGWLQVYDDDVSGPTMTLIDVVESAGGNTILATSFESTQGWPASTTGYSAGTNWNVTDVYGTWYGSGAFYTTLNNKNTGTRRVGLLVNTNAASQQWLQLPPVNNPGVLSVYAARFSGADTTIRVERADSGTWVNVGQQVITNLESVAFQSYTWNIDYTGNAVTLRVMRVGSTGPQVSLDDLSISSTAEWISTNQLTINWAAAVDDYSALSEYRLIKPAISTTPPATTNDGALISAAVTSSVQSIMGHQGIITGFIYAVDNDSDRANDAAMGNIVSVVVRVDTNPPPVVGDFAGSNDIGDVDDTTSKIRLTWNPKSTESEAGGWRQSDSMRLSSFVSYRVYIVENEERDAEYTDPYVDYTSSYTDLGTHSTAEITIEDLTPGFTYSIAMAGVDEAGNVGPMTETVIITLDIFGITRAFASEESYTVIQWEGRDDGAYDVIYADSTGYTAQVDTMWKLAETVIGTQFIDQGGADIGSNIERDPPVELASKWMRFYRVAPVNAWIPAETRPGAASEEVVVAHQVALMASNNFIGISMSPMVHTLAEFFGTNRLPSEFSSDNATRINLYSVTPTGDPDDNTLWLSVTGWLDQANGWANTNELPYPHQGFDIYVPYATNLLMVGRVPWTNSPTIQIETQSYNVLSMNLPRPTKVSDLGITDMLTWGMNMGEADEVRIMQKGTAPWGQPRGRMFVWTNGTFRFANNGNAQNFVIEADEAVIIYSRKLQTAVDIHWAGTNYYPKPTVQISTSITAAPTAKALSAIILNGTNALLRGTVNPNGLVTATWFQYGTTTNYGTTLASINLPATNVPVNISTNIYGLIPGARYYFQVVASNALGLSRFGTGSFLIGGAPDNMVYIPEYTYIMGATTNLGDESNANELPQHAVTVSPFFMDKYEVTALLWSNVYGWAIVNGYGFSEDGTGKDSDHPIVTITWYDAVKWCNARSEMEGRTPVYYTSGTHSPANIYKSGQTDIQTAWVNWTNSAYRLPTEAEWERAARGGVGDTRFPWTDYTNKISHVKANFDNSGGEGYQVGTTGDHPSYNSSAPYTSPVGSFGANAAGLYDMAGNVREMCWDWYDSAYYSSSPGTDPRGAGSGTVRVNRGSGWGVNAAGSRIAARHSSAFPNQANNNRGFRTVISAP